MSRKLVLIIALMMAGNFTVTQCSIWNFLFVPFGAIKKVYTCFAKHFSVSDELLEDFRRRNDAFEQQWEADSILYAKKEAAYQEQYEAAQEKNEIWRKRLLSQHDDIKNQLSDLSTIFNEQKIGLQECREFQARNRGQLLDIQKKASDAQAMLQEEIFIAKVRTAKTLLHKELLDKFEAIKFNKEKLGTVKTSIEQSQTISQELKHSAQRLHQQRQFLRNQLQVVKGIVVQYQNQESGIEGLHLKARKDNDKLVELHQYLLRAAQKSSMNAVKHSDVEEKEIFLQNIEESLVKKDDFAIEDIIKRVKAHSSQGMAVIGLGN